MVVRPFRPETGPHTASAVLAGLAQMWDQAKAAGGQKPQARLAAESGVPAATVNDWARGKALPRDAAQVEQVGTVLARWAGQAPLPLAEWERLLEADQAARGLGEPGPGQPIGALDPFALEVHRPVTVEVPGRDLPLLPPYVCRSHDEVLAEAAGQAAAGRSVLKVLVGGSSTGKTRACWEVLRHLPDRWRLWHPFDPTRPEAALADLIRVGPLTVVWLNETQLYLDTPRDTGERVAAALTTLLTDAGRGPVLVLGTLWPEYWDALTREDSSHPQARLLLAGADVRVPETFTGPALDQLRLAGAEDPRLAAAAAAADGQITQFLAGAPVLLARYRNAPPPARAVIEAAMDARRLGHGPALPHALLETAAPAYLTDTEWDTAGEDWLEQALAYTAAPCKGTAGPLTRIRPRPSAPGPGDAATGPAYRLADWLDQHGRAHRADTFPPDGFWIGGRHTRPSDQIALAVAARDRGLYRHAAQLFKYAADRGNLPAPRLVTLMAGISPADPRAAQFAVACASLKAPATVAWLLEALRETGANDQAGVLLARDPAAHASLEDARGVAELLEALRKAGAGDQAAALAARATAHVSLEDPESVAWLLPALRKVSTGGQVAALLARAAARIPLEDAYAVTRLLKALRKIGAGILLARDPAAHVSLEDLYGVGTLLEALRETGANDQAGVLLARDPAAHAPLEYPGGVAWLLEALRKTGAGDQAGVLLARDPAAHASLEDARGVARLLEALRKAGAGDQVAALAARATAHASLEDPWGVQELLKALRETGAGDQAAAFAARATAHVSLENPANVAWLLEALRETGANDQAGVLLARDPAAHVSLENPANVAWLLEALRNTGAGDQAGVLLARDPAAHVSLEDPWGGQKLLEALRKAGAHDQAAALAARLPSAGLLLLNNADESIFRFGRDPDGSPARPWGWDDLS